MFIEIKCISFTRQDGGNDSYKKVLEELGELDDIETNIIDIGIRVSKIDMYHYVSENETLIQIGNTEIIAAHSFKTISKLINQAKCRE